MERCGRERGAVPQAEVRKGGARSLAKPSGSSSTGTVAVVPSRLLLLPAAAAAATGTTRNTIRPLLANAWRARIAPTMALLFDEWHERRLYAQTVL